MQDFKFEDGIESFPESLLLFDGIPQDTATLAHKKVRFYPDKISKDPDAPITLEIDANTGGYIDGSRMELTVEAKIVNETGDPVTATDKVTFANQALHTMFSNVIVKLNDIEVNPNVGTLHGYKNYLETLCFKSDESKNSIGSLKGYYPDSTKAVHRVDPTSKDTPVNTGLIYRYNMSKKGAVIVYKGKTGCDFLERSGRLLPNGIRIRFEYYQQRDAMRLVAADNNKKYSVRITNLYMTVCIVRIRAEMLIRHAQLLGEGRKAMYPFPRTVMRSFNIPKSENSFTLNRLMSDRVPSLVILVLVQNDNFAGKYNTNCFDFKHNGLNCAKLSVDNQTVPHVAFRPDFDAGKYTEEYSAFLSLTKGKGNSISQSDFAHGNTVLVWSLHEHVDMEKGVFPVLGKGFTTLELTFKADLSTGLTGILYMSLPGLFKITQERNVEVEY